MAGMKNKLIALFIASVLFFSFGVGMARYDPPTIPPQPPMTFHSTTEGGDWHDHMTWVENYVPTKIDVAIISDNSWVNITQDAKIKRIELHLNSVLSINNSKLTFMNGDSDGFLMKRGFHDVARLLCSNANITAGYSSYWFLYKALTTPPQILSIVADNTTFWNYCWGQMDNSPYLCFDNCTLKCGYGYSGCIRVTGEEYEQETLPFFKNCHITSPVRIYASGIFEHCVIDIEEGCIAEANDDIMVFYKCFFPSSYTIQQIYTAYYPIAPVGCDGMVFYDYKNNESNIDGEYIMMGTGEHYFFPEAHDNQPLYLSNIPDKYKPRFTDKIIIGGSMGNPYLYETIFDIDYTFYKITFYGKKQETRIPHTIFCNATFTFLDMEGSGMFSVPQINYAGQYLNFTNCTFTKVTNNYDTIFDFDPMFSLEMENVVFENINEIRIGD